MQPSIHLENPEEFEVFELKGRLDAASINSQKTALANMIDASGRSIILNLKRISLIDSTGLRLLVSANRQLQEQGRKLALCEASDQATLLFELTRLNLVFDLFDSQSTAMAAM